jgi:GDP-D-mannose dehydratase
MISLAKLYSKKSFAPRLFEVIRLLGTENRVRYYQPATSERFGNVQVAQRVTRPSSATLTPPLPLTVTYSNGA